MRLWPFLSRKNTIPEALPLTPEEQLAEEVRLYLIKRLDECDAYVQGKYRPESKSERERLGWLCNTPYQLLGYCIDPKEKEKFQTLVLFTQKKVVLRNDKCADLVKIPKIEDRDLVKKIGDMIIGAFIDAKLQNNCDSAETFAMIELALDLLHIEADTAWQNLIKKSKSLAAGIKRPG